ncbi:bifunctional glutamate N-acetyltransferase/amino-acid acetyltransferase ArgJ [Cellulomonas sp. zg-ZUI222]|uniref:Arginine biosynthesis bifunctional protein ArgJ n=1 Tax=Cellulomonas wangleii TaxID=2816956 RepID=A0ABX8DCH9_9CELL|nr:MULTISPECIES: bifunctional glutamate N-acetyltransferase/amino-acid acetyltransferase ArgJ [Cellulomonas]MBO0900571.1 bifunctional glutamate N-acetyltransferase/amino-acid acetyltransferase ArgJ [Cellulomonas sp. zg-ZUI22]MBO0921239.1 bifunctional glutamate N-acetyltransferase/amino-acid acetyltransferase ArgJ [Cellulomonas wangleii]MBO0925655.1 bifunctional glutamate N-acetyltransferase/amino-acid acetyltransferase ArgJ [Cellulomonas wangleii]QVI63807.1 bifunctional glutamate N-acetyltransf
MTDHLGAALAGTSPGTSPGVTAAAGFRASGVTAGLKASGTPDMALVVNDGPRQAGAAVFTTNRVVGAPVVWSRQVVTDGVVSAVVLNSGGANVSTGPEGFLDSHMTAERVASALGVSAGDVVVCSTGLIGERLPREVLLTGVDLAAAALGDDGLAAATAIMTTDSVAKTAHVTVQTPDGSFTVGGMAKGAGMLAPALATMLCVLTTDADVEAPVLDSVLRSATARTFDRVDSDGCMSTSDTVTLLASGASGVTPSRDVLADAVLRVCASLARQLVADAEGASHDVAVHVVHATDESAALAVARAVTRSNLFKAAIFGNDPNWGRVLAQAGTVPEAVAPFDPEAVDVSMNGVMVCRAGRPHADRTEVDLAADREVHVVVDLHAGDAAATVWSNDLTHEYVHENSAYST